jgi:serine protease Do
MGSGAGGSELTKEWVIEYRASVLMLGVLLFAPQLIAQKSATVSMDPLDQMSASLAQMVAKVAPAIVRVEAVGYSESNEKDHKSENQLLSKNQNVGSGIVFDANGYIVTNAHVVKGAKKVQVILDRRGSLNYPLAEPDAEDTFDATVIANFAEADISLLKIAATGLHVLPLADSSKIEPGQLVFAVGNPDGLNNSVSMGIVSAVARETGSDTSPVYIQTDAAINPGSSGGALVDIHGRLVGMTSFIVTESGGSEGLGFALPSGVVSLIYNKLRSNGNLSACDIGLKVQRVTATMARGLGLSRKVGLIVSDVVPSGPAEVAGIRAQDILLSIDGNPVTTAAQFVMSFYTKSPGDQVRLKLLRESRSFTVAVSVRSGEGEAQDPLERLDLQDDIVRQLGIVAAALDRKRHVAAVRSSFGVFVAGKMAHTDVRSGLEVGDLIRSVNGTGVQTLDDLQSVVRRFRPGDAVVLQVERRGEFRYLSFEAD